MSSDCWPMAQAWRRRQESSSCILPAMPASGPPSVPELGRGHRAGKRCKSRYPPTTTAASICHARRSSPWLLRSPHAPLRPALGRVGSYATLLLHPHAPMLRVPVHPTSLPGPRQLLRALSPLCVSKRGPEFTPVSDSLLFWGRGLLATKSKAQATAVHSLTAVLSSSARSSGGSSIAASVIKPTQERPTRRNLKHVDRPALQGCSNVRDSCRREPLN